MRTNEIGSGYTPQTSVKRRGRMLTGFQRDSDRDRAVTSDRFTHGREPGSQYTDYDRHGKYREAGVRLLPERYYDGTVSGCIHYKNGTVTYVELLEEAVMTGAVVLNEKRGVWDNVHEAERALIISRLKPLYAWSTTLYSEDGQYRYEIDRGRITSSACAYYDDATGRRITAQEVAEQLACGLRPSDLDGGSFLAELDRELYEKACMIGKAKRIFEQKDQLFARRRISQEQYIDEVRLSLLYFLGQDDGLRGAAALRRMVGKPEFGKRALEGAIAPAQTQTRRVIEAEPEPPQPPVRTRRKITLPPDADYA